jgi:hypothetical protein
MVWMRFRTHRHLRGDHARRHDRDRKLCNTRNDRADDHGNAIVIEHYYQARVIGDHHCRWTPERCNAHWNNSAHQRQLHFSLRDSQRRQRKHRDSR